MLSISIGVGAVQHLSETTKLSGHAPAEQAVMWLFAITLAFLLTVSIGRTAAAFDCLAYKPEGARGRWHAEVVAGKICWFGANWRSFLPKNAGAERSTAPNKKRVQPTAIPEQAAEPTPVPPEITELKNPEDLPGLRQATPAEASALINAISLEFQPIPSDVPDVPEPKIVQHGSTELTIIFGALAVSAFGLATIVYKRGSRRTVQQLTSEKDPELQIIEDVPLGNAPPLQPSAVDEHQFTKIPSWLKRAPAET
jgi:hypothetical protein